MDELKSDLEDDLDNLMNNLDSEFVLEEILQNELDSDYEPLHLLVSEANYHVFENAAIEKILKEGSRKAYK